ncbi:MAG: alpha/beta hydrolase [Candidatus Thorarchaeota archaeon]|nr:alpha/beta hydrolase [Candidatus Thorarchaeota archaeon]
MHYEESGRDNDSTIIFVHGAGGNAATWIMQLRGLARNHHVIALELNGHGNTPDRSQPNIMTSYLDDIDEIVTKFARPILAGHSMGGALTQLYALSNPDKLRGIILIGTGARLKVAPIIFDMLENNFDAYIEVVGSFMFNEHTNPELIESSKDEVKKCPARIIRRDFELCNNFDIMNEVSKIALQTLILVGSNDIMTPVKYSEYLHSKIPNSCIKRIDSAGHIVMLEQSSQVNNIINAWMKSLP